MFPFEQLKQLWPLKKCYQSVPSLNHWRYDRSTENVCIFKILHFMSRKQDDIYLVF